jgi:hypothetical protein
LRCVNRPAALAPPRRRRRLRPRCGDLKPGPDGPAGADAAADAQANLGRAAAPPGREQPRPTTRLPGLPRAPAPGPSSAPQRLLLRPPIPDAATASPLRRCDRLLRPEMCVDCECTTTRSSARPRTHLHVQAPGLSEAVLASANRPPASRASTRRRSRGPKEDIGA